jgi:hypothetical protein
MRCEGIRTKLITNNEGHAPSYNLCGMTHGLRKPVPQTNEIRLERIQAT